MLFSFLTVSPIWLEAIGIWQLREVTFHILVWSLYSIYYWLLFPHLPFYFSFHILLTHFFKHISIPCWYMHYELLQLSDSSQFSNTSKKICYCCLPLKGFVALLFESICTWIMAWFFFPRNLASHLFYQLFEMH